jgi:aspartate racemase
MNDGSSVKVLRQFSGSAQGETSMRRIGILGGMSWESTALYYRLINGGIKAKLGGLHSADLVLRSVDFHQIESWQAAGDWDKAEQYLSSCARDLQNAGAEGLVIATNTMHKVASGIVKNTDLELIHIADCTGERLVQHDINRVGLMATGFTMEQAFYRERLSDKYGLDVRIPNEKQRQLVHKIIYEELCLGHVKESSRAIYKEIAEELYNQGAQSVILGCTEIGMLLTESVTRVPLIDTTLVHAEKAVDWMLDRG